MSKTVPDIATPSPVSIPIETQEKLLKIVMRRQATLSLSVAAFFLVPLLALPWINLSQSAFMNSRLLGFSVTWLILGLCSFPLTWLISAYFVQAFQYWAKVFAISVPVFVIMAVYGGYNTNFAQITGSPKGAPRLAEQREVTFRGKALAPANAVAFSPGPITSITFLKPATLDKVSPARKLEPSEDKLHAGALVVRQMGQVVATSPVGGWSSGYTIPAGAILESHSYAATRSGEPLLKDNQPLRNAPKIEFLEDTVGVIALGSADPLRKQHHRQPGHQTADGVDGQQTARPDLKRNHQRRSVCGLYVHLLGAADEYVRRAGARHLRQNAAPAGFPGRPNAGVQDRSYSLRHRLRVTRPVDRLLRHRHDGRLGFRDLRRPLTSRCCCSAPGGAA